MFYRMRLFKGIFLHSDFFLTELNFLKGDTNIYFKQITFFKKKKKKKRFCKNHKYLFLKIYIFFQLSFATFEQLTINVEDF